MYFQLQRSVNKSARKKVATSFSHVLIWRPEIYILLLLQDFSYIEVPQRSIKKGLHYIMLLSCLLYAILTRSVFNSFSYIYIWGNVTRKSQQNYVWFNTLFSNVKYSCLSTQNNKSLKKKRDKEKNSYYAVTEMLKGQTVHQSISLYPTIVSSVQLFLGPL